MIRRHNMTPVQWAVAPGLLKGDTALAHCILLDDHPQIRWHTSKDLDPIAEAGASAAHFAIVAGRLMSEDIRSLDTAGAFEAVTLGGAAALGRDDTGALASGIAADIVLVDGEIVLKDGNPVHLDPATAMELLAEAQARMLRDSTKYDYLGRDGETIAPLSLEVR